MSLFAPADVSAHDVQAEKTEEELQPTNMQA